MEDISRQLIYQRLRNRVIELFELHSSFEDVAMFGAFSAINLVDDSLPLDYSEAPKVFNEKEKEAVAEFLELFNIAADATNVDNQDVGWFESSKEWMNLSNFSKQALLVFAERGRFSEEHEEALARVR